MTTLDPASRAAASPAPASTLDPSDTFANRHLGPDPAEVAAMLEAIGVASMDELIDRTVPDAILSARPLGVGPAATEHEALEEIRAMARQNRVMRSAIGMGYHDTITPPVILRNVLENPGWYTQYTPYQAELAQGRLEALLNFQTMVADLTGLPLANASLLDEATAAAEAMVMCRAIAKGRDRSVFLVADDCHPQTIEVVAARAEALGIECRVVAPASMQADETVFGALLQSPNTHGVVRDDEPLVAAIKEHGAAVVVATDLLALTLMRPPGEYGADVAVGSAQRFGVPMGMGGPHAAFLSTLDEHARKVPGRLVGVSRDVDGNRALRLAIQTREQHIKRDRATSNICTAQVLLAIIAGMYAVYHGPEGLRRIARRVQGMTAALATGLRRLGYDVGREPTFDTLRVPVAENAKDAVIGTAHAEGFDLREHAGAAALGVALDETTTREDVKAILHAFNEGRPIDFDVDELFAAGEADAELPEPLARRSGYLTHEVFNTYHSETEMLRYLARLQSRDLSLAHSMIPLGSCTMKLNATAEMIPVTWPEFGRIHPFAPSDQVQGYHRLFDDLERWLADITGFHAVSLQPNAGSQGEYAGLLVIRAYHRDRGDEDRRVCLIPVSAHGTNPASAVAAGFEVVPVQCDERGDIDLEHLREQAQKHEGRVGAMMITYPSTHGVFESRVREACTIVHEHGGLVYLDGANMNAMVGVARPGEIGADVCHLNLHKTFCIPHGGGGPGMGPIGVVERLAPFLPTHSVRAPRNASDRAIPAVSAAPYGSPSILPISWMYVRMMGDEGLRRATETAILNANYMAKRLAGHYDVVFKGETGFCAHEFIIDCRPFDRSAGIKIDDIAKRLMDFGFHAPTMSWPVAGTLMIEPTESESKAELDRYCDALIAIREEIRAIEEGRADREDNILKRAPHPVEAVSADEWDRPYSRSQAAWPLPWLHGRKFWPPVSRVDNPFGDRNLVCSCAGMESYDNA